MEIDSTEMEAGASITIKTSEGTIFRISRDIANLSNLLKNIIDDLETGETDIIPLFNVNDKAFHWFQIWAEHHVQAKDIKPEAEDRNLDKSRMMDEKDHTIKEWDQVFIDKNVMQKETQTEKQGCQALIELVMAANYMSVTSLYDLAVISIAKTYQNKKVKEIQELYDIDPSQGLEAADLEHTETEEV